MARSLGAVCLLSLLSCGSGPAVVEAGLPGRAGPPGTRPATYDDVEAAPTLPLPRPTGLMDQGTGPGVLLPAEQPEDQVVTQVGGFKIHKSHVYDRQLEEDPLATRSAVDRLVFDVLIAQQALKHGITVDPTHVGRIVHQEEERLAEQVAKDWDGRISLEQFLRNTKDVDLKTFRLFMRRHMARRLYRYYVIRFLGMQEDRVQVRLIRSRSRDKLEELRRKVLSGADFRSLALRESEHSSQRRGGLLEPFAETSPRSFAKAAFALKEGEVSSVLATRNAAGPVYDLLYCVKRLPRRSEAFDALRAELDKEWLSRPITREESMAAYMRLRAASERLNNAGQKR